MAAAFRDADRVNLADYSSSHRTPPPIPQSPPLGTSSSTTTATASSARARAASHSAGSGVRDQQLATRSNSKRKGDRGDEAAPDGQRRGSLPFLRRTLSSASTRAGSHSNNDSNATVPPVPHLPNTRISQAHADAAARRARSNTTEGAKDEGTMLRKVSGRSRQQEKGRQAREASQAAAAPRQPPSLPLPTFNEESHAPESRDSIAIFNSAYNHSTVAPSTSQPRPTANFSRPAMPSASNIISSSSPAYAARSADAALHSSPAIAPRGNGEYVVDDRTQSMTHRGRYSYASSVGQVNAVSSPRRVRRRKDPTPFNVLVIGAKNSGKTCFISFLKHSLAIPAHKHSSDHAPDPQIDDSRSPFKSDYLETEIDGERVGLTIWDSAGLEKSIVDLQLRELSAFVEAKFEDTFVEEQKVMRSAGAKDTHIHCVFLVLDPVRLDATIAKSSAFHKYGSHSASLDEQLDLQVLRALWGKTTVIPVISKADTLTVSHMKFLKRAVWEALRGANLNPLEALELEEDEEGEEVDDDDGDDDDDEEDSSEDAEVPTARSNRGHKRQSSMSTAALAGDDEAPYIPMSILSPDIHDLPPYAPTLRAAKPDKVGRRFPWGFADPHDPEHCDFGRFRDSIFSEWRSDLRELSRTKWYENWRTTRLQNLPGARQRIKGGVTPVAAVPKEGRSVSGSRQFSPPSAVATMPSNSSLTAGSTVPRSVSNMTNTTAATGAVSGRDFSGSSQAGSVRGGTYRGVESYK